MPSSTAPLDQHTFCAKIMTRSLPTGLENQGNFHLGEPDDSFSLAKPDGTSSQMSACLSWVFH